MNKFCIERCYICNEIKAFYPKNQININLSVGGTKILTALIDSEGKILWESIPHKWRQASEEIIDLTPSQKRSWLLKQIRQEILKAKNYLNMHFPQFSIEGIGLSWAGPISRNNRVIGPNIEGFKIDQLSPEESLLEGVDLIAMLKTDLADLGSRLNISILNDADAEGLVAFKQDRLENGILLIVGTGIGAGIIKQGKVYFGPDHFKCRMGEIGHHVIYNDAINAYTYYGISSQGIILSSHQKSTMMDRLAGPGIARRFLDLLWMDFKQNIDIIFNYLNSDCENSDKRLLMEYYHGSSLRLELEQSVLQCITHNAKMNDLRCIQFISNIGYELGSALKVFLRHFQNETFTSHIKIAGSVGKLFGKDVASYEDLFLENIRKGICNF